MKALALALALTLTPIQGVDITVKVDMPYVTVSEILSRLIWMPERRMCQTQERQMTLFWFGTGDPVPTKAFLLYLTNTKFIITEFISLNDNGIAYSWVGVVEDGALIPKEYYNGATMLQTYGGPCDYLYPKLATMAQAKCESLEECLDEVITILTDGD